VKNWSSRWLATALAAAFVLLFSWPARSSPAEQAPLVSTMLTGKVRATGGEAMAGVTVSARMIDSNITTSVFTDESGDYYFPVLSQGKYRVWAQAKGFEAARAELDISRSKDTRQEFTLKSLPDYSLQLSTFEYLSAMDQTNADRRMAKVFSNLCASCHPGSFALQNRFDEKGWLEVLDRYKEGFGEDGPQTNSHHKHELIQHYKPELAAYLARMRGPGPSEMKLKLYPRPTGDAARVVITEYSISLPGTPGQLEDEDGSDWSQGIPSGYGTRGVHDVGVDAAGYVWFSDREMNRYRSYGKLDPRTGETTDFKVPGPRGMARMTHGLKADKDGVIWIELRDSPPTGHVHVLERLDGEAGEYTIYDPTSAGTGVLGNTIEQDGEGKIWTSATPGAYAFDPVTKKFTYYQAPTKGVGGYGVAGDADGNGWFGHPKNDIVGIADYKTGKTSEIKLTIQQNIEELLTDEDRAFDKDVAKSDSLEGKLTAVGPRRMSAHGDYVWWGNWFAGTLSRADIHTHEVKYFDMPYPHLQAYGVQVDRDGNVWPTLMGNDLVAKLEPSTGHWTTYPLPSLGYEIRHLAFDYRNGREEVWVPSNRASKIAHLQFRTESDFAAIHAKASQ
jgi:streptogramin lyase